MTTLILLLGLGAVFFGLIIAVASVTVMGAQHQQVSRSLAAVEAMRTAPKSMREELDRPFADRVLGPGKERLIDVGRRFTPAGRVEKMRHRLDLAGNPPGWDVDRILGLKALFAIVGAVVGLLAPLLLGLGLLRTIAAAVTLLLAGWFGPSMWLYQKSYDRTKRMQRELPDALDLLTISVEAGLAFDAAIAQVARNTEGPLAEEFFRVLQEMQIGTGRMNALRGLAERTDLPDLRSFVGAMVQADAFGIPISSVLRVQAKEMRIKRSQRAEEAAQKIPVKILFPLIFCILPCLFVVIIGPAVIQIMRTFQGIQ